MEEVIELEQPPSTVANRARAADAPKHDSSGPTPTPAASTRQRPQGLRLALVTAGLILTIFLAALDTTIIATAIPRITSDFGNIANITWYGSAYGITNTAFGSCWGKVYKNFQMKPVFLLSIAVFEAGNVICATAVSSEMLILGRVVSGIGGGGMMTGSFIIIAGVVKEEWRAAYMGIVGVTFGTSSVVGPLLGGVLTDSLSWRWCFWISLPIGGLAAAIMFWAFHSPILPKEGPLQQRIIELDLGGGILVAGVFTCFVLGMHWSGTYPWSQPRVFFSLLGSFLLFVGFIINEWWMGTKAMIQAHILKKRAVAINLGFIFFLAGVFFPLQYTLPIQFQSVGGTSASQSGIRLIPLLLGICIFTMVANGVLTYWRHYKPFLLGGAILATAGVSCIYSLDEKTPTAAWIGFELLAASGIGLALQVPMVANQAAVGLDDLAAVTSLTLFTENCGTLLFIASEEAAFTQALLHHLGQALPNLDPHTVLNAGATQIRNTFGGGELEEVLSSYLRGCKTSHIISVACGVVASLISMSNVGPAVIKGVNLRLNKSHMR